MTAALPAIKALTVCPGYLPYNGAYGAKFPYNRGLVIELTQGQAVQVVIVEGVIEQRGACAQVYALTQPIVEHYRQFLLQGGNCPIAPVGIPTCHRHETDHEGGGTEVMDLPETRETDRVKALRRILKEGQAQVVEGVLVDTYSAGTYLNVHGRINEANQARFAATEIVEAISKCYRVLAKAKENGK